MENLVERLKKGAGKIGNSLKAGAAVGIVYAGLFAGTAKAEQPIRIMNFEQMGAQVKESSINTSQDYLKQLDTVVPGQVVKPGSHWHAGFIQYVQVSPSDPTLTAYVVGYAENKFRDYPGWEGKMMGGFLETMGDGNSPDDMWFIEDVDGDGIADYYPSTQTLSFDEDDEIYFPEKVMIGVNKVYGDLSELPAYLGETDVFLPEIIIDARTSNVTPMGMDDLAALAYGWLSTDCHPYHNGDCDDADFNFDHKVNLADFLFLSANWDPNYIASEGIFESPVKSPSLERSVSSRPTEIYSTTQDESGTYVVDGIDN